MRYRADKLSELQLQSGTVKLDEAGFLVDPADWTPDFAKHLATQEGIDLNDAHWEIFEFMRAAWHKNGVAIDARHVFNFLKQKHNTDKTGAKDIFFDLFPYGYVKQAVKMSGMKQPRAWSTG